MEPLNTRDALKIAAMRLFADRGVEAVSVRDIILEAGVKNGGSLNYYFGTKEGLITEIVGEIFTVANEAWMREFATLQEAGGPKSVREIMRIIVYAPPILMPGEEVPTSTRVIASLLFTRRKFVADLMRKMNLIVFNRMLSDIEALMPQIPRPVMRQRIVFAAWYMSAVLSAREVALREGKLDARVWNSANALGNLVDTATAVIEAPMEDVLLPVPQDRERPVASSSYLMPAHDVPRKGRKRAAFALRRDRPAETISPIGKTSKR